MGTIASQIKTLTILYSTFNSGADQTKHKSSASLAFVWGIRRGPVNSSHKYMAIWWRHHDFCHDDGDDDDDSNDIKFVIIVFIIFILIFIFLLLLIIIIITLILSLLSLSLLVWSSLLLSSVSNFFNSLVWISCYIWNGQIDYHHWYTSKITALKTTS